MLAKFAFKMSSYTSLQKAVAYNQNVYLDWISIQSHILDLQSLFHFSGERTIELYLNLVRKVWRSTGKIVLNGSLKRCNNPGCDKLGATLACSNSNIVAYCSSECQRKYVCPLNAVCIY
jgi:hypothetical protein